MKSGQWLVVILLVLAAPLGAQSIPERVVQLDLARAPGPIVSILPAPLSSSYRFEIENRAPAASYSVTVGAKSFTVDPVSAFPELMPEAMDGTLNCRALHRYPLGRLCVAGARGTLKCADKESEVRSAVAKIRESLRVCKDLKKPVEQWLAEVTTGRLKDTFPADSSKDWETAVEVKRLPVNGQPAWVAKISTCAPETQLEAYLKTNYPAEPLVVLAFDHQSQTWSGRQWDTRQLNPVDDVDFENSFTNKPKLYLKKGDQLAVFTTNTNPLLFSSTSTAATEANREDIANLQKFTLLLGSFLGTTLAVAGQDDSSPFSLTASNLTNQSAILFNRSAVEMQLLVTPPSQPPPPPDPLKLASNALLKAVKDPADKITKGLQDVQKIGQELDHELQKIKETNAELKTYLQLVESNSPKGIDRSFPDFRTSLADVDEKFSGVAKARDKIAGINVECPAGIVALKEAVQLVRLPLPEKPTERLQALDRFSDLTTSLGNQIQQDCHGTQIELSLALVASLLPKPTASGATPDQDEVLRPLFKGLEAFASLVDQRTAALKTSGDLLASRGDIAKTVGGIQVTLERRSNQPQSSLGCSLRSGVLQVSRVEGLDAKLRWSKVRSEGFQIAVDSGYKDSVALHHPAQATASYELARATKWDFDIDIAVVYTGISDPVFSAVKRKIDGADKMVIERTDNKTRSGGLAMFLGRQWRKNRGDFLSVGPQLGVGVSTDKPALFGGVGFGLGPYLKVSTGWSWQKVSRLGRHQTEGMTIVDSKDDIKIRDTFDNGFYASLAITVDDLPFFKAPEK